MCDTIASIQDNKVCLLLFTPHSPPTLCQCWSIEYRRGDGMSFPRLDQETHCSLHLLSRSPSFSPSFSLPQEGTRSPKDALPWGEVHMVRNWGPLLTVTWEDFDMDPLASVKSSDDLWRWPTHRSPLCEGTWARAIQLNCSWAPDPQKPWGEKCLLF